jgi:hypothetical protein
MVWPSAAAPRWRWRAICWRRSADAVAGSIAADSGLTYRDTQDGESIRGVYRRPLDLASGRFAMLDDGVGFSLVPWRPVMDAHLGNELRGIAVGGNINWDFSRSRGLSRWSEGSRKTVAAAKIFLLLAWVTSKSPGIKTKLPNLSADA